MWGPGCEGWAAAVILLPRQGEYRVVGGCPEDGKDVANGTETRAEKW